jgi:hypothetical protein
MIVNAIALHPILSALIVVLPLALGFLGYYCPAATFGIFGILCLIAGAGLALLAIVSLSTPSETFGILGSFVGIQAAVSAIGSICTGAVLIAAAGAIASLRRMFR